MKQDNIALLDIRFPDILLQIKKMKETTINCIKEDRNEEIWNITYFYVIKNKSIAVLFSYKLIILGDSVKNKCFTWRFVFHTKFPDFRNIED